MCGSCAARVWLTKWPHRDGAYFRCGHRVGPGTRPLEFNVFCILSYIWGGYRCTMRPDSTENDSNMMPIWPCRGFGRTGGPGKKATRPSLCFEGALRLGPVEFHEFCICAYISGANGGKMKPVLPCRAFGLTSCTEKGYTSLCFEGFSRGPRQQNFIFVLYCCLHLGG